MRQKKETKFFETEDFKNKKKYWDKELEKSGFNCIEKLNQIVEPAFRSRRTDTDIVYSAKEEFYRQCRSYLHEAKFKLPIHQRIWELYSEGFSIRQISKTLSKPQTTVYRWIDKHRKIMRGLK